MIYAKTASKLNAGSTTESYHASCEQIIKLICFTDFQTLQLASLIDGRTDNSLRLNLLLF